MSCAEGFGRFLICFDWCTFEYVNRCTANIFVSHVYCVYSKSSVHVLFFRMASCASPHLSYGAFCGIQEFFFFLLWLERHVQYFQGL